MRRLEVSCRARWRAALIIHYAILLNITAVTQVARHAAAFPHSLFQRRLGPIQKQTYLLLHSKSSSSRFDILEEELRPTFSELRERGNIRERLVELPVMFTAEGDGESFDMERWDLHRSSWRYLRLLSGILFSVTTQRILPTVLALVVWSGAVDLYNSIEHVYGLPELELPLTPFELTAPILGLLLVFRSDRASDRFNTGSSGSWEITNLFKTITRELWAFTASDRFGEEERTAASDLVEACVRLHGWILIYHLRGKERKNATEQMIFLRLALGDIAETESAMHWISDPLTPTAGLTAISLGVSRRLPSLDFQESTLIESQFGDIVCSLGKCESILRTPIPLGYTRYSVRFLWVWLSLLPFALVNKFAEFGVHTWWEDKPQPVLVFAMLFIGFIFVSIEDIAVQIEEPFSVLPLELHQKWLIQDVKQMEHMNRLVDGSLDDEVVNGKGTKLFRKLGNQSPWR